MTRLTTFSKTLIVIGFVGIFSLLAITCYNCTNRQQYQQPGANYQNSTPVQDYGTHQVISQPGGSQVVIVKDHSGSEFFMDYLMFQSLMNMSGGMNNVYGYYNQHRYDPTWDRDQTSYRTKSKTVINNYYGTPVDDTKSFTEQVKQKDVEYQKSNGFSKPTTPINTETQSRGFSGKWFDSKTPTSTPEPKYEKSSGFESASRTSTYKPSNGFENSTSTYKSSSGFKSNSTKSTYKPSSGFKSSNGNGYKSSSGFKKKN